LYKDSEFVKSLLKAGAEKEARGYRKRIPPHLAVVNGDIDTVLRLLGLGLNITDKYGHTPLHVAARNGKHQVVQLLIDEGADIEANEMYLRTPLHVSASNGKCEALRILVRGRANQGAKDYDNKVPHHLSKNGDTTRELLNYVSKSVGP
jgi:ankyrin repeat protein